MDLLINQNETILKIDDNITEGINNTYKLSTGEQIAPKSNMSVVTVDSVPTEVEVRKYCYNETEGFYKNPNYRLPNRERIDELETALANLMGV